MKPIIITERQKGLLFRNGRFVGVRGAGKYRLRRGCQMEISPIENLVGTPLASSAVLLDNAEFRDATVTFEVPDGHMALHFRNGHFVESLPPHSLPYVFWKASGDNTFQLVDTTDPEVGDAVPARLFAYIPSTLYTKVEVPPHHRGCLMIDHRPTRLLDPGVYYFWRGSKPVACDMVDTRLVALELSGQEMLTRDKVTLRVNFICHYRITDFERILSEPDDYREHLHVAAQLALREYVGMHTLDDLLGDKEALSRFAFERLCEKAPKLYVTIHDAGVKDIILPGEIRDIMNTVLVAEKQAQANVITRREEVASTRSLLNTAKLMEENPTLYRLKEMECIERICERVGHISLSGSGDVLGQLAGMMSCRAERGK